MKNKKKSLIAIAVCIVSLSIAVVGGYFIMENKELKKYQSMPLSLPESFKYTAHTGCSGTEDNSIESIEAGIKYGAGIVEFDLNFDKDGNPVLSHDKPKENEVTLEEAFKKLCEHPEIHANVDVKITSNLKAVQELSEQYGVLDQIFYTGIEENDVEAAKKDSPKVPYFLNMGDILSPKKHTREYILTLTEKVKECGAVGINFNYKSASKLLVDVFHEEGLQVSIWTVNSEIDLYRILSYAPDNITTKNPELLQRILSK